MLVTSTSHLYGCDRITAIEIQRTYFSSSVKTSASLIDTMQLCENILKIKLRRVFIFKHYLFSQFL